MQLVAVITFFHANSDHPIATTSCGAGVEAGIAVVLVTVVTSLKALLTLLDVLSSDVVSAARDGAGVSARVDVDSVAVITSLTGLAQTVAAARRTASV